MVPMYPRRLIRGTAGRHRFNLASEGASLLAGTQTPEEIEILQLRAFNQTWLKAQEVPFYLAYREAHNLPTSIKTLEELDSWPVLTKAVLRSKSSLVEDTAGICDRYWTSGSTSEPYGFPRGKGELDDSYKALWSYRMLNGVAPFDPFVATANIVAGASISKQAELQVRASRILRDIAGNSWTVSGYIPTPQDADVALRVISLSRVKYLVGYASAIVSIARRAKATGVALPALTHAILTSETIAPADIEIVENSLGVKVLIEYGAIELGAIAGTSAGADDISCCNKERCWLGDPF